MTSTLSYLKGSVLHSLSGQLVSLSKISKVVTTSLASNSCQRSTMPLDYWGSKPTTVFERLQAICRKHTWNLTSCYGYSRCRLKIRLFLSCIYWSNIKPETFVTSAIHKKWVLNYCHDWAFPHSGEHIPILVRYLCCKTLFLPQMLPCFPHQKTSTVRKAVYVHTSNHNIKDSREQDEPRQ